MPETELINLKINGIALQAPKGESVIEAATTVTPTFS